MIYTAALKGTNPDDANVCNIPTDAEELCIIAVTAAPAKIPKIGLKDVLHQTSFQFL